jgi:molybdate transport system substrate-binding protein
MTQPRFAAVTLSLAVLATLPAARPAAADDLTVLCSNGLKAVADDLIPKFERETKHRVKVTYGLAALLEQRIEGGEAFDVALLTPVAIDALVSRGTVAGDSRTAIARTGLALEGRAGTPKPDIASVEAFKRTLLGARAIAYAKEGASGVAFAALVKELGIAKDLESKSRLTASGEEVSAAVVDGTAEFGVLPLSEILPVKGVQVAGIFPAGAQRYIMMVGGVNRTSKHDDAARALIKYLTGPAALPVIKAKGMEQ